jgi:hypothetical protein
MELTFLALVTFLVVWFEKRKNIKFETVTGLVIWIYVAVSISFSVILLIASLSSNYVFERWLNERSAYIETYKSDPNNEYIKARAINFNIDLANCKFNNNKLIQHYFYSSRCDDIDFIKFDK